MSSLYHWGEGPEWEHEVDPAEEAWLDFLDTLDNQEEDPRAIDPPAPNYDTL